MNYVYSNSYLECYKKQNSFELNKNVILKRLDSNVRVLFRETYLIQLQTARNLFKNFLQNSLFWKNQNKT